MPDFAGASLKLRAEGEEKIIATLDRIERKTQESFEEAERISQKSLNDRVAAYDAMYGKQQAAAQSAAQRIAQYEREVAAEHLARMRQQAVADREYEGVQREVEQSTDRIGTRALASARAFEVMARTGKESGRSLDTLLSQVGYVAFGFGAQGALVGAIAIGTAAIVELFSRTGRELDKLTAQYDKQTEHLMRSGSLLSVDAQRAELFSGAFSKREKGEDDVSFLGRSKGFGPTGLEAEAKRLNAAIDAIKNRPGLHFESDAKEIADLSDRLREVNTLIGVMGTQWSQLGEREKTLNQTEAARVKIEQDKRNLRLDSRAVGEYQNEELNRIVARIKASGELIPSLISEHDEVVALKNEQAVLRRELDTGNLSVQQRIDKERELARVTKEYEQLAGTSMFIGGMNIRVNPKPDGKQALDEDDKEQIAAIKRAGEKMKEEANRIANEIGRTLAHGITDGIKTWFSGGGFAGGFKAMTAAILDGLGQMFAEVAEKALIGSTIMQKVIDAIQHMNPWVAAVAAGALLAFGNSLRSSGSSGGSGGSYSGGGGSLGAISNVGTITPQAPTGTVANPSHIVARPSTTNQVFVIGKDAMAWRQVQEQLDQNARRG